MRKKKNELTFTKIAVIILLFSGLTNSSMPFILALCGKETVTELGMAWLAEIVSVFAIYAFKAYFENKQEAKQALKDYRAGKVNDGTDND